MSWPTDPPTSAVDALAPELRDRLMAVLESYLVEQERGLAPDAEQLVARHPELAEPLRAYLRGLDFLHRAAAGFSTPGRPAPTALETSERQLGDFAVVREIGRGGMGIVYEARQISLDRRVALKVLPFAAVLDRKQIARFTNEARASAQLHHPNIVPVFAVGCERGVHYYAMQYIEGQSLELAIRQLRESAGGVAGEPVPDRKNTPRDQRHASTWDGFSTVRSADGREYARSVAELAVQAADALQHAHEYGIIHRDVKPSNLLLDERGKLWVTDFGLARIQADAGVTTTGDVLGTLRYMSPEQAAGRSSLVDQRTDVYSLGVTLYELLTLRDVFEGTDRQELLRRIEHDEPRLPRRIDPAIPVDLETIVLKAISKSRDQRYATAEELADDLRRFLEGKPTLARRPTPVDRAVKWARRHQPLVWSAVVLALITLMGSLASTALVARANLRKTEALQEATANYERAEENRRRAESYFRQARRVVDRFAARHADQLAGLPGAERLRQELLCDALQYYHGFIREAGDDPAIRADLALAYFKAGAITEQIEDAERALAAYRKAKAILAALAGEHPNEPTHRRDLALCHNNIGLLLTKAGKTAEAQGAYQQAIRIQKRLVREDPESAQFKNDLALVYGNLGLLQSQTGRSAEAEQSYGAAIEVQEELVRRHPGEPKYQSNLAISYNNLSFLHGKTNPAEAERSCRDALAIQQNLVEAYPGEPKYQSDLALAYNNLGALQGQHGRLEEAKTSYEKAIALQRALQRKGPSVLQYRRDLAISYNNLGRAQSRLEKPAEADASFAEARTLLEDLVEGFPDELGYRSSLGGILNNQGMVLEQAGRLEDAAAAYREAIAHQRFALERAPSVARFREFLGKHYWNLGRALRAAGRPEEAAEAALARRGLWPDDPERLFSVARELALTAGGIDQAEGEAPAEGVSARQRCADEAVATLRQAVEAGFAQIEEIRENPDLESIRAHPEFRQLAGALAKRQGGGD